MEESHKYLRRISRTFCALPGCLQAIRVLTHYAIGHEFLPRKTRQQLFNLFAKDTAPMSDIVCTIHVPCGSGSLNLKLNLQDDLSRTWYHFGYNSYEAGTVRLFCELLKTKSCIFDIGANIGYYSLLAAAILQGRGCDQVHAFEPMPDVFRYLLTNAELNRFDCLHLNPEAVSNRDGQAQLWLPGDRAWSNASLILGFTDQSEQIAVETIRFDTYCAQKALGAVDLVKIDVEGAELNVLEGMGTLLDLWHPDIICEVLKPYEDKLNAFFLEKPYYRKFLITDEGIKEVDRLCSHAHFRDYYLSCNPTLAEFS